MFLQNGAFFLDRSSFLLVAFQTRPVLYSPKSEKLVMLLKKRKAEKYKWFIASAAHLISFSYLPQRSLLSCLIRGVLNSL